MNKCFKCYFYKSGYMSNSCSYFQMENFYPQDDCDAFSEDGNLLPETEDKIFKETNGVFGEPINKGEMI